MDDLPLVDSDYLRRFLVELLNTPSPTGFAEAGIRLIEAELASFGLSSSRTNKGGLVAYLPGESEEKPRALTAHVDTLGALVKEIKDNGRLKLSKIGSYSWNTIEGEGCTIMTGDGHEVRGSILPTKASGHIFGPEVGKLERNQGNLEVRLDARTNSSGETSALGIRVGDPVALDPRVEVSRQGFIRSRHLDDKASVACILAVLSAFQRANRKPLQTTTILFSDYEEVGHGAATGLPPDILELVAIDMAPVGEGQASDEFHTTICIKDSEGPYHAGLTRRLRQIAEEAGIPYQVDIYPHYASDGEAYWRAGGDARVALIGPGVDASHNYERTHMEALEATARLVMAYLAF